MGQTVLLILIIIAVAAIVWYSFKKWDENESELHARGRYRMTAELEEELNNLSKEKNR